jgi:hypothetical protein
VSEPVVVDVPQMHVKALITDNYAKTIVTNYRKNRSKMPVLTTFAMNIPQSAFVSGKQRQKNIFNSFFFSLTTTPYL